MSDSAPNAQGSSPSETPAQAFSKLPHYVGHMAAGELIESFDQLVAQVGLGEAVKYFESLSGWMARVVQNIPEGCTKQHTFILVHMGETDKLGTGGWDDTERPFGPKPGEDGFEAGEGR